MENQTKEIEEMLEKLDFVRWDRYVVPTDGEYHFYGWINKYRDGVLQYDHDFIVLSNVDGRWWYLTSSVEHSKDICRIVDGTEDTHVECQRVEDDFIINNAIKLKQ